MFSMMILRTELGQPPRCCWGLAPPDSRRAAEAEEGDTPPAMPGLISVEFEPAIPWTMKKLQHSIATYHDMQIG